MSKCIHEVVCKHNAGIPCSLDEICKLFRSPIMTETAPKSAGKKTHKKKSTLNPEIIEDVKYAKKIITARIREGLLNDNQLAAFKMYKGTYAKSLDMAQRVQMIDIFNSTTVKGE